MKRLKFSLFILLAFAFVFWLFTLNKSPQTPAKIHDETNASKQAQLILNAQNLSNSAQIFAQNATQTDTNKSAQRQEKKRVKGLFVDYYADNPNDKSGVIMSDLSDKFSIKIKQDKNLSINLNAKKELNATQNKALKTPNLKVQAINVDENLSANLDTNLSLASKIDTNFIFDKGKTLLSLMPHKGYVSVFSPILHLEKSDKNASTAKHQKPKLCIIIDDMATREQVNALKATGLKLTPSFFPPDSTHPKTPILAREFEFFMVHLPLSAQHYANEELQTLYVSDTYEYILAEIARIKRSFSGLKFINNHTGSLFTSDTQAMRRLFRALQKHELVFVDSVTTSATKGAFVAKEFNQKPIKRDIFLDNDNKTPAIKDKIKEAVQIAHKNGFAIAIAHPKKNTFKALTQSKDLLQSVELVYLDELYENP